MPLSNLESFDNNVGMSSGSSMTFNVNLDPDFTVIVTNTRFYDLSDWIIDTSAWLALQMFLVAVLTSTLVYSSYSTYIS